MSAGPVHGFEQVLMALRAQIATEADHPAWIAGSAQARRDHGRFSPTTPSRGRLPEVHNVGSRPIEGIPKGSWMRESLHIDGVGDGEGLF
jgi:hypothetical protein